MPRFLLSLVLLLVMLFPLPVLAGSSRPASEPAAGVAVGSQAPDFTLEQVGGGQVSLGSLRGKIVLVNFWATWCPPCKAELPSMERLYARMKKKGLEILAVNVEADGREILPKFLDQHPHTFPVLLDLEGEVQASYGVFRFPETFVVGKDGKIIDHIIGGRDWADKQMIDKFNQLIGG